MIKRSHRSALVAGLAATALVLGACGGDDGGSSDTSGPTDVTSGPTETDAPSEDATFVIENAWARNSPAMTTAGAAYMDITASANDTLVGASVDASIAGTVEIHEVVPVEETDDTGMTSETMEGGMVMRPVDEIALPAGEVVNLMPGGYHVMMLDLVAPLEIGQTFELTLEFGSGATQTVEVEVLEEAPSM